MFDGELLLARITVDGTTLVAEGFRVLILGNLLHVDGFALHANQGVVVALLEALDFLLIGSMLVGSGFQDSTLARGLREDGAGEAQGKCRDDDGFESGFHDDCSWIGLAFPLGDSSNH